MRSDGGGVVDRCEIKASMTSSWNQKLSQIAKYKDTVYIVTYSLPNIEYMKSIFDKSSNVVIVCHSQFRSKALQIKKMYPSIRIYVLDNIHSKLAIYRPCTTILSSANLGSSGWIEHSVIIKSERITSYYFEHIKELIQKGTEVKNE